MRLVRTSTNQLAVAVCLCIASGLSCGSGQADEIRIISDAATNSAVGCGDGCNPVTQQGCLQQNRGNEGEELLREGLARSPASRTRVTELVDYLEDRGNLAEAEELRSRAHSLADDAQE